MWGVAEQRELLSRLGPPAKQAENLPYAALSSHSMDCCRGLGWAWALRSQTDGLKRNAGGVVCAGAGPEPRRWCGGNSTSEGLRALNFLDLPKRGKWGGQHGCEAA